MDTRSNPLAEPAPGAGDPPLVYVDDTQPGYRRVRVNGSTFHYLDTHGKRITDEAEIKRIHKLVIPPAYEDVWICPLPHGHLQATGRDARGRKQYRYHPAWAALRDAGKYQNLLAFGQALPRIRRRVARDMKERGLTQNKVIATLVRLLETTLIRIGAREYARSNKSYGLTTLTRRHATVAGSSFRFRFVGKSGDEDGAKHPVDSGAVNAYLRQAGEGDFTAKHYRTWAGSAMAYAALQAHPFETATQARQTVAEVIKQVSKRLANTPAVCRACYVHPALLEAYLEGRLPPKSRAPDGPRGLHADERRLLEFLRKLPPMDAPAPPMPSEEV